MSIRLGYACINTCIQTDPAYSKKDCPGVNKSCVAKTFREKGVDYAIELAKSNLTTVLKVLEWNEQNGIRFYRLSSDMLPHITNPEFLIDGDYAYPLSHFTEQFKQIGAFAKKYNHRLTFHPGQYNQVGATNPKVFEKTALDLKLHADILDAIGCDLDSIMVVHGGGVYGNKEATIKRWAKQFFQLPKNVQCRLVIENCERQYNYKDMLRLSKMINRPVVFDTHHHQCYCSLVEPLDDPSTFIHEIIETWTKLGLTPKCHISEQAPSKRIGAHSNFVNVIPQYLLDCKVPIDIMIEAKAKEQATLYLYDKYFTVKGKNHIEWKLKTKN
jgi:UV DNA damage endonuclease